MTPDDRPATVRILVALDASPASLSALVVAAEVAMRLGADLVAVFVEDVNVVRLGHHPAVREVAFATGTSRRPTADEVAQALAAQERRARRALAGTAGRMPVRWTFAVRQGQVAGEVVAAGTGFDLIALGHGSTRVRWPRHLGSNARAVLRLASTPTLFVAPGQRLTAPFAVLFDESEAARRALDLALRLSPPGGPPMLVLVPGDKGGAAAKLAAELVAARGASGSIVALRSMRFATVVDAVHSHRAGSLVIPAGNDLADETTLERFVTDVGLPVVVVK